MKIIEIGHKLLNRVDGWIKKEMFKKKFKIYKSMMNEGHPFKNMPMKVIGDCSADPYEFFNHYDAFSVWLVRKLKLLGEGKRLKILDVGSRKVVNAIIALEHDVTSIVLKDCEDSISDVKYIIQDIVKPLDLPDNYFDVFTSTVTLHLVGLGRYGDELNPYTLINFIGELDRVMKKNSDLIFSISYGKNCLTFNEGWKFDIQTLKKLFSKWELYDWLIDNHSGIPVKSYRERFTKDLSLDGWAEGEYRVIFLHFRRGVYE